ncbi:alpha-amylase family protein [Parvularcula oceani]|uniref:alpha-amylase family protein n=1 Tax=Parvularcula oceani TaxID=1247963 RepID=UPI0004E21741|nr:alpha-amylase family protein [Parvularcula oceani]
MIPDLWYKNAVLYNLSLESFLDSDGDGIGDFDGLMRRLDYLRGLGVTAIWLAPFYPSPRRDNGYDIEDYYGVDPRYGSLGDFVAFTHAARQRGMRVLVDLVINHTSDQHPWFQAARDDPSSKYRDYYIWADEKPKDADDGVVFPGVQETTWTRDEKVGAYYFHKFYEFQPDLNIANPEVRDELRKIMGYWLALGVSGFRMDAVPFLIARDGVDTEAPEPAYEFLRELRAFAQWRNGDVVLLAEANVEPKTAKAYFGEDGDRLHMIFGFPVNQALFYALATGETALLREAVEALRGVPDTAQWAHFLRNHDELSLDKLTEEQRSRVFEAFAPDEDMRIFDRGIRRRLPPMLGGDRRRIELANSLMLTLPGTPVLRYGDEIGMGDDLSLEGRFSCRTPMQWSGERNAGFTSSKDPVRPVIDEGDYAYECVNVARQRTEAESLLSWTERMLRMRLELPEIGWGEFDIIDTQDGTLAISYAWQDRRAVFVHNFTDEDASVRLPVEALGGTGKPLTCLQTDTANHPEKGHYDVALYPYGYRWFRLGGLEDMIDE